MKRYLKLVAVLAVMLLAVPMSMSAHEDETEAEDTPEVSATARPSESPDFESEDEIELEFEDEDEDDDDDDDRERRASVSEDLQDDVDELFAEDEDITEIEISGDDERVQVKYRLRARLFGVIEVPYELEAHVDIKGKAVEADGPWWLLFATDNVGEVRDALEAEPGLTEATNQGTILSTIIGILRSLAQ